MITYTLPVQASYMPGDGYKKTLHKSLLVMLQELLDMDQVEF